MASLSRRVATPRPRLNRPIPHSTPWRGLWCFAAEARRARARGGWGGKGGGGGGERFLGGVGGGGGGVRVRGGGAASFSRPGRAGGGCRRGREGLPPGGPAPPRGRLYRAGCSPGGADRGGRPRR